MIQYNQADIETMIISAQARDKSRLQELIVLHIFRDIRK